MMPTLSTNKKRQKHYPFAAIVGQTDLKLCLILCAIDPTIGGVLIRGDKGTAKSTAARGLAHLLPKIDVGYDSKRGMLDPYNQSLADCDNDGDNNGGDSSSSGREEEDDEDAASSSSGGVRNNCYDESRYINTPFVDLPIGATEDRVLGSIDFSRTLKSGGSPIFAPGLLAAANRGILYIDEVNLLPAHLVDVLLDAAAMGVNAVQREGLSVSHAADFFLIGTMNAEEGNLRPQLLDRFGLMVDVVAPRDPVLRSEVVRQRIMFERDRVQFGTIWEEAETELARNILTAKERLSEVVLPEELLLLISRICTELHVGSLRADITLYKSAMALAAWHGRLEVLAEDIKQAAKWVLAHRRREHPMERSTRDGPPQDDTDELLDQLCNEPPPPRNQNQDQDGNNGNEQQPPRPPEESESNCQDSDDSTPPTNGNDGESQSTKPKGQPNNNAGSDIMQTFTASKPGQIKQLKLGKQQKNQGQPGTGSRNNIANAQQKTRYVRSAHTDKPVNLAMDATLRAAASNGISESGQPIIHSENWRKKVYSSTSGTLILFVVDASGSMSARKRMESVKGAVLALLADAYQKRDRVGVISFRGTRADLLLEPTKSVELAERALQRLPTGGRTPLAHALMLAYDTIKRLDRQEPEQDMLLIVLSDGKANVPLPSSDSSSSQGGGGVGGESWVQTEQMASQLARLSIPTLMLDTDAGHVRVGRGKELGELLQADYMRLEDLSADGLVHSIRQAVVG